MLTDLYIKNFAIIDNLHVAFREGLNVLTGETGAGKSIIIDAVNLVLGGRASVDLIRTGEEEATVEALFDLSGRPEILAGLAETGVECDGELLVKRMVSRTGRNRVFVGGGLSTISVLADLAGRLINIYGQHESQTLLKPENHLLLLDDFGALARLREEFTTVYDDYRQTLINIRRLDEGEREAARRIDLLSFQSEEIGSAGLLPDEEEDLARERELLVHGEKLLANSRGAFDALYGGDDSILGHLRQVLAGVGEIRAIDAKLSEVAETLNGAYLQLEDAALALRDYASRVETDPQRLQAIDDRLDLIFRLKKKYAPTVAEIIAYREEIDRELAGLMNRIETRGELEQKLRELEERMSTLGKELSLRRKGAAKTLKAAMEKELKELAMKNALFEVALVRTGRAAGNRHGAGGVPLFPQSRRSAQAPGQDRLRRRAFPPHACAEAGPSGKRRADPGIRRSGHRHRRRDLGHGRGKAEAGGGRPAGPLHNPSAPGGRLRRSPLQGGKTGGGGKNPDLRQPPGRQRAGHGNGAHARRGKDHRQDPGACAGDDRRGEIIIHRP